MAEYVVTPESSLVAPMRVRAAHVPQLARLVGQQLQQKRLLIKGVDFDFHVGPDRLRFTQTDSGRVHSVAVTYRKDQA